MLGVFWRKFKNDGDSYFKSITFQLPYIAHHHILVLQFYCIHYYQILYILLKLNNVLAFECALPENIHTSPTEGIGISWRVRATVRPKKFKEMYEAQLVFPEE